MIINIDNNIIISDNHNIITLENNIDKINYEIFETRISDEYILIESIWITTEPINHNILTKGFITKYDMLIINLNKRLNESEDDRINREMEENCEYPGVDCMQCLKKPCLKKVK